MSCLPPFLDAVTRNILLQDSKCSPQATPPSPSLRWMRKRQAEHEPLIDRLGSLGVDDEEAIEASMPAQHTQRSVAARVAPPPASSPATQPATQRDAPPPSDAAVRRMGVAAAVGVGSRGGGRRLARVPARGGRAGGGPP